VAVLGPAAGPPDVTDAPVPLPTITVCELHAGLAANVTPDSAELTGTLRYAADPDRVWRRMEQVLAGHAAAHGVEATLHRTFSAPPVVNDPRACATVAAALVERFTMPALRWLPGPLPTSDDFAEYLAQRPGRYVLIGAGRPDPTTWVAHSTRFDIDEAALPGGVDALAAMVGALLDRPPPRRRADRRRKLRQHGPGR
jgi:hippurate hydrolase